MGEWLIYGSNGTQKATVKKLEYSGEFMGETSVTCDIYSPSPISFSIGDYLVYRGERFTIDYDATRLKQARNNTYGKGYTYENMRFLSYVGELKKCEFLDFVPNDNLIHFSQLPDFSFYAETVKDLADRLQVNLDRIYTGSKAWSVQVVQGFEGKENINVSVSKAYCFDALRMAYDKFDATFIIRGRTITIGTAGNELETDFRYGKGNGLKTIERSVDESDSLVTRLRAYGNTTNLPANYYKNIGMRVYAPIYEIYHVSTTGCDIHFVPKLKNACFSDKNGQYSYWVTVSLDETLWLKAVASPNNHLSSTAYSVVTVGLYGSNTQAQVTQFLSQLQSGTYDKLYFKEGINVGAWPVEYREYAENVPNLMAIDRLMLPGFPELTTDPYIDASNISTLGVREKSVYFDGSDPDTPDIHPTLEGMTAEELRAAGYTIDLDAGDNGNLDEIAADATETDGSPITADGAFEGVDEVPGFKVSIKDIGFDINDYLSTETATLVMKTGMCGGREFTIVNVEKVGNKYVLECQRTEDVSHYFPYNPYLIKAGDKFVLTNIEMPKAYIDAASQRLLAAAQAYIAKYSAPQWVYAIKMDDIWMQRQRDNSVSEASSYYWNIKEGDVMNVTDSDLGVDISEVIDRLTIREGYGPIPEFEVVLRKEKPQGTIGVLQNRIRQLELRNAEQVDIIRRQQNYLTFIFGDTLADVMSQLDKKAETWYQANDPSSAWTNDEDKAEHVGDLWMDISANGGKKTYIYQNTGTSDSPNYQWVEQYVPDEVFDEIDGKAEIFVEKPTAYHERDMWIIENGISSSDLPTGCVAGDIVISSTDSTSFNKAHWSKKDRYTDDSSLNAFISGTYADDLVDIQTQIDGKAETWYQNTDPSTAWTTTALKNQHKGDIWHNSSTSTINGVKAGQDAIWNGTAWVVDETVPQAIYDEIDGKCAIYVTWGAWGNDLQEKDLFIPAADTTQGGVTYKANKVYRCVDKDTPTFQEIAYTDDTQYNGFITKLIGSSGQTKDAAENAIAAIKHALSDGNTYNEGGLILSNLISLGTGNPLSGTFTPWAGISGIYKTSETGTGYKGHGIAAWFGGGMVDGEVSQSATNAAKSLFRFDGSGYVAGGNLSWDKNGNVTIQGYSINATTLQVGGSNVATQAMLDNFVSKAFFNRLFTAYDANGNAIVPNDTTTAINNLKIMVGTWTEQYLSALGLNSEGGGGGTGTVTAIKVATNTYLDPDADGIIDMSSYATNWNDAYNKRHTHSNKSVLDGITSTKVSHWDAVYGVVPQAAYESGNQLADKNFVNSSISTSTATFRGTNTTATTESAFLTWANGLTHDLNDYVFWSTKDSAGNTIYKRYKYDGSQWVFEYDLNNSSFTSDQWSAINSGITSTHVSKLNGIASGAQVNVIESVKVNGTALSISSKAVDITAVPLSIITGADDLKAIEGLSGTSGFLKKTAANTWALDTTVVLSTRKVSTGNGLQGGGDLSADRTISILLPSNSGLSVASTGLKLNIVNDLDTSSAYRAISATQAKKIWDLLNQMFTLEGSGTTASPYVIKANYGLYTEQFLSALGQNSQGGSGGTTDLNAVWGSFTTNTDEYANEKIDENHLPIAASDKLGAIKVGSTLQINSSGVLNQKSGVMANPDVYTKVTVDTYGRVTQGGSLLADDIPTLSMSKISGLSTALGNVYTKTESDGKYITAIGTNGNYLTYTKNGNSNSITVPYATSAGYIRYQDTRNVAETPTTATTFNGVRLDFKSPTNGVGVGTWNGVLSLDPYSDYSGGYPIQLGFVSSPLDSDNTSKLYLRTPKSADTWNAWRTILDTSNTSLSNGVININGSTITPLTAASNLAWSKVTGTPTTLSGYGITDAYTKTEADSKYLTSISVSGDVLKMTKNGATTNVSNIFEREYTVNSGYINTGGWYRIGQFKSAQNKGSSCLLFLTREYGNDVGESYIFAITLGVLSDKSITQLSGKFANGLHIVDKIRIEYQSSYTTQPYIDFHLTDSTRANRYRVTFIGSATALSTFEKDPTVTGSTIEFSTRNGVSTNYDFNADGNATVGGTLGVTGAATLYSSLSVTDRIYTPKRVSIGADKPQRNDGRAELHLVSTSNAPSDLWLGLNNNDIWSINVRDDQRLTFYNTSVGFVVNILLDGKVGIGTQQPSYKLHVNGDLGVASGITLTTTKKIYFGDSSHYLELDANGYFHFSHGLYSDSFVSALGANDQGGGSSTFDEEQMWEALDATNEVINASHIPNLSWAKITNRPTTLSGYGILDAYTKTQADAKYATISSLSDYLPLTGGTMTGILKWEGINALPETTSPTYMLTIDSFANGGTTKWANLTNVTVGKAATATTASKLGTSTVGSTTMPIYLNAGTPTQITSFPEAYLSWGGKNFAGSYGAIDAAMINELGANRMAFMPAAKVTVEYSRDNGATWLDYGATDDQKVGLTGTSANFVIGKSSNGNCTADCKLRITFTTQSTLYTVLNKFALYVSTKGSTGCKCSIQARTQQNYEDNVDTWANFATDVPISGWSGWNIINTSGLTTYGNVKASQYGQFRFIFGNDAFDGVGTTRTGLSILQIKGFGGQGWGTPSNMAANGHIYRVDVAQHTYFPSDVRPQSNNTIYLGGSSYRWAGIYATALNLNGSITGATTGAFSSDVSIGGRVTMSKVAIATNYTDTWSDGTNSHPWYGYDGRYGNTASGVYSTTISDYYGMTLKTGLGNISMKRDGNVGIGTFDPSYKLDVNGTLGVTGATTLSSSLNVTSTITSGGNINVTKSTTTSAAVQVTNSNGSVILYTATNRGVYEPTKTAWVIGTDGTNTFLNLGNVGIGNSSPSTKLDVNGTLNASGAVTFGSTLGVTGATTLTGLLTANGNIKTGTSNGAYIQIGAIKLVYDSTNNALKVIKSDDSSANFYATGAVSALGANSSGGSSTFDEDSMWAALDATNEVIGSAHIPNLDTSKITSGTFAVARIPSLAASKITSGTFDTARIPNLSWNKITSDKPTTLSGYGITDAFTQTQSFDRFYSLYGGKAIEASSSNAVDLNNLTDEGSYYCETNTASGYVTNKPGERNIAFRIWVSKPTGTTSGYVRQRFQYYDQVAVYERIDTNLNSVSWGSWYKVQDSLANYASTSSLDDYLPLSGGQMTGTLTWKNSTSLPEQTSPDILLSIDRFADGGTTKWVNAANVTVGNATTATKLSTVSKTAWGQTYWTSGGVPTNISGNMSNVGNITMDGYLYMANQNRIYFKSSGNTDMIAMYQTAANHLYIGYGFASEGYSTYIAGNTVELRYGTSRTTGLTLDGGDVTVKGKVCVGTGGANSYLASDAADNIYLRNSSGAVLVCDGKVVRRSTSLSDVTLGSSSYPWGGLYSTTGSFSSTLTVSGTSTFNAYTYRANTVYDCWYDSNGDAVAIHSLSSANNYWVGYGLCPKGYELRIGGGSIRFYYGTSRTAGMLFNDSGYLGVGNTNPSQRLHVTGNILASGEITGSSDERKKNIISNTKFNVRDIASARSIIYEWNDGRDKDNEKKIHGGSIAQDWLGKADSFLSQDNDGFYSINYGALALCSAITIAREVLKHEDRITKLERENAYLKNRVNELERRIA